MYKCFVRLGSGIGSMDDHVTITASARKESVQEGGDNFLLLAIGQRLTEIVGTIRGCFPARFEAFRQLFARAHVYLSIAVLIPSVTKLLDLRILLCLLYIFPEYPSFGPLSRLILFSLNENKSGSK